MNSQHTSSMNQRDEQEIRQMIADWSKALDAKDLKGLTADYMPDAVLYDAIPPYKTVGVEAIRAVWKQCLPYFPEKFKSEHKDISVHVSGDTAFVYCVHHFIPTPADHPCGQTWMRVTLGYQRVENRWKVVHEHVSVPFNPMTNQAWFIRNPEDINAMPDYSQTSN